MTRRERAHRDEAIRRASQEGTTVATIAAEYGLSTSTVVRILRKPTLLGDGIVSVERGSINRPTPAMSLADTEPAYDIGVGRGNAVATAGGELGGTEGHDARAG